MPDATPPAPAPTTSTAPPRRFLFDRAFLDRMDRALLCLLVAPHADALSLLGIPLADLRASAQTDRRLVEKLYDAAHAPTASTTSVFPAELRALFITLSPLATTTGQAALIRRDAASPIPLFVHRRLPPADLVASVHLEAPHLLKEVRVASDTETADTFTDFAPTTPRPFPAAGDARDTAVTAFTSLLSAWLVERSRSPLCRVRLTETAADILLVIEFCAPPTSFDTVDERLELTQINAVTTDRALAVFDKESGGLSVHGWTSMKEALRRFIGACFFADARHFTSGAVYSLEPLRHLDVALDPSGIPGLEAIELRDIQLLNPDDSTRGYAWSNGDLRKSANDAELRAALATQTTIQSVKLYLKIKDRKRPTAVTLTANRKKYLRRAADVERVLNELLLARGIMKLPERAATTTEIAATSASIASIAASVDQTG